MKWYSVKEDLPNIEEKVGVFSDNDSDNFIDHIDVDWLEVSGDGQAYFAENKGPVIYWTRDFSWPTP